jgi:hypothetical protein
MGNGFLQLLQPAEGQCFGLGTGVFCRSTRKRRTADAPVAPLGRLVFAEPRLWPAASRARFAGRSGTQQGRTACELASNQTEMQSTKFEPAINLKTAKALGLTVSNQMQLLADKVE